MRKFELELSPVIIEEGKDRYSLYSYHYNKRIIKNLTTTDWRYLRTEYDPIIIMWKDKYKFSLHSHRHDNGINLPKDMWHRIVDKSRDFEQAFYVVEQFLENRGIKETVPEGYLRGVIKKLYEEEKLYEKQIRKRAYEIWERKGRPTQSKEEQERDWFEAKKEIEAN